MHKLAIRTMEGLTHLRHHLQRDKQPQEHQSCHQEEHHPPSEPVAYVATDGTGRDNTRHDARRYITHVPGLVFRTGIERGHRNKQLRHDG